MIELAVLDAGGTTVADGDIVLSAFDDAFAEAGLRGDARAAARETARATMGMAKADVFGIVLGPSEAVRANDAFEAAMARRMGELVPVPGAEEAVLRLRRAGIRVVLATGFSPATRDALLARLGWEGMFDLVISPGGRLRGRPFPDTVLDAVISLRIDDVRSVAVVGDTTNDLLSGHRAGAGVVVGVLTGVHRREELVRAPHTHIVDSIADVPGLILAPSADTGLSPEQPAPRGEVSTP